MKTLIIVGAILGALVLGAIGIYGYANSLQMEGVARETELNAQYLDNQNELSTYISKFYETVGIANLKSDKMDQILTDAVKGRYEGHTSAQVGQGQLFSAIKEAYPNIDLSHYDRILDLINSGRDAYKQKQSKLLDMLRSYDKWRESGIFQSMVLGKYFPSNHLEARIGTSIKHGAEARDQMYLIVLTQSTTDAYNSGHLDPLSIPGAKTDKK
jgi:hypothetical protein